MGNPGYRSNEAGARASVWAGIRGALGAMASAGFHEARRELFIHVLRYSAAARQHLDVEHVMDPLSISADMRRADGEIRICEFARDIVKQPWTVPAGNLDDGQISRRGAIYENSRRDDEGGMPTAGGRRLSGPLDAFAAQSGGAQICDDAVEGVRVIAAERLSTRILHIEDIEHAIIACLVEVSCNDVRSSRTERAAEIGEQAGPVRRRYENFCGRASRIDGCSDGDRLACSLPERRRVSRLRLRRKTGPVSSLDGCKLGRWTDAVRQHGARSLGPIGELGADAVLVGAAATKGGFRCIVKVAQQLTLPAIPHAGANGANVRHGQDKQKAQSLEVADPFGELGDGLRVGDVTALRGIAHLEVIADEPGRSSASSSGSPRAAALRRAPAWRPRSAGRLCPCRCRVGAWPDKAPAGSESSGRVRLTADGDPSPSHAQCRGSSRRPSACAHPR